MLESRITDLDRRMSLLERAMGAAPPPAEAPGAAPVVDADGVARWYRHGVLHRDDGPAVVWPDGRRAWWTNGVLQRIEPAGTEPPTAPAAPPPAARPAPSSTSEVAARAVRRLPPLAPPAAAARRPRAARGGPSLDDLTSPRVLAWVGATVTLLGIVFLFVFAVHRGWITEPMRVGIGVAVSLALVAVALRLYARDGKLEAVMAAAGAGIAGLYTSLLAATALYDLVSVAGALPLTAAIAALAVAVGLRVDGEPLAGFALAAAALAPLVVTGEATQSGLLFSTVTIVAAAALVVARGWRWQMAAVAAATAPHAWLVCAHAETTGTDASLLAVASWLAGLYIAAAVFMARSDAAHARFPAGLVAAAASVTTLAITAGVDGELLGRVAEGFALVAAGGLYAALTAAALRVGARREALVDPLAVVALAYVAAGCGELFAGPSRPIVWAVEGAALAAGASRFGIVRAYLASAGYLALAAVDVFAFGVAPADLLEHGAGSAAADDVLSLAVLTAALVVFAATLVRSAAPATARQVAPALPLAAAWYLLPAAIGGESLVVAWAAGAAALAVAHQRRLLPHALPAAIAFLAAALTDTITLQAPTERLFELGGGQLDGIVSLVALLAASVVLAWAVHNEELGAYAVAVPAMIAVWLTAELLGGQPLAAAWAIEGAALTVAAARWPSRVPVVVAAAVLAASAANVLTIQATPRHLLEASPHPASGLPSLLVLAAAAFIAAASTRSREREVAVWAAGALALHAASLAVLGVAEAGAAGADVTSRFQGGHMVVSSLWALTGLWLLHVGVGRARPAVRLAAFALLGAALAKLFLYDLAFLSSFTRAGSFIAVGAALLTGAALIQRLALRQDRPA